jgi:hypothetical protein
MLAARAQQPTQAQQQPQDQAAQPTPAARLSPLSSLADTSGDGTEPQELLPDARPLAGAQDLSLGFPATSRSYWQPNFNLNSTGDSNGLGVTNSTGWAAYASVLGGLDVHKISGSSDLTLSYIGGGNFSSNSSIGNSTTQQLELAEKVSFRRSTLSLFDQGSYFPETSFGYGGLNGLTLPGGGSLGLLNNFLPGQSILTARGQRASNSSLVQVDTFLAPRFSLTFLGGYSLLRYVDNDLLNSGDIIFQGGYNRQLTREDTLAVFYRFNAYRYSNFNQSINDHSVQVSYGRRVTGRLAFEVAAGPEFAFLRTPITGIGPAGGGGSGAAALATSSTTLITWNLNASLTYQLRRTGLRLAYSHGLTGGSGVLAGALTDTVTGSISRQLSRTLGSGFDFGYARNSGLAALTTFTPASGGQTYDYWFGGANLTHPFGRTLNLFLAYQLQYQNSNSMFCIGPTCKTNLVRHTVSMGLNWRGHPAAF